MILAARSSSYASLAMPWQGEKLVPPRWMSPSTAKRMSPPQPEANCYPSCVSPRGSNTSTGSILSVRGSVTTLWYSDIAMENHQFNGNQPFFRSYILNYQRGIRQVVSSGCAAGCISSWSCWRTVRPPNGRGFTKVPWVLLQFCLGRFGPKIFSYILYSPLISSLIILILLSWWWKYAPLTAQLRLILRLLKENGCEVGLFVLFRDADTPQMAATIRSDQIKFDLPDVFYLLISLNSI